MCEGVIMDAKVAWEELEEATNGAPTPLAALTYLSENADGWVATFARMACLVFIAEGRE